MTNAVAIKVRWVWGLAFLCAGLGCGLMGPLLPVLARQWGLADNRSGLLLGLLLAGSCGGTLTLQRRLEHAVRRGVFCAAAGMVAFALCTRSNSPFTYVVALLVVSIIGFGLGSLMSAVNLLAGRLPVEQRTGVLAAAALGGGICPLVLGQLSMFTGLRGAMALPVFILVVLS